MQSGCSWKMLSKVTNENELKMSATSFIDKGARLSKLVEGAARNPDEKSIMQLLCTFECAIRIDELWDTLKGPLYRAEQYD